MLALARSELARVVRLCVALSAAACSAVGAVEPGEVRSSAREAPLVAAQEERSPAPADSALVLWSAGWDAILADPRDAGLRRALGMLDERLLELWDEIDATPPPPGSVELVCEVLSSPFLLDVDFVESTGDAPPVRGQLMVQAASEEAAGRQAARIEALVTALSPSSTMAPAGLPGLKVAALHAARLFWGAHERSLLVSLGEPRFDLSRPSASGLPSGVEPVVSFTLDTARMRGAFEPGLSGPDGAALRRELEWLGLLGEDPLAITGAWGHGTDRDHMAFRIRGWKKVAERQGLLASGPLSPADLAVIPADATFVYVERVNPGTVLRLIEMTGAERAAELRTSIEQTLGLDLETDLITPLGETLGFYLSWTTGGGGLPSAVVFAAVDDEARLTSTLMSLGAALDGWASARTASRVHVRSWKHAGVNCLGLVFPGLPVPCEPSAAIFDGHLFLTATPEALIAALGQARAGGAGLLAHPAFRATPPGALDELQSVRFLDTPSLLSDGYQTACLLATALANGVRSRSNAARDPELVLPPYAELAAGARPSTLFSRIEGDDLVGVAECDRSVLAQATALAGAFQGGLTLVGLAGTVLVPPFVVGRVTRTPAGSRFRATADIIAIENAANQFAIENSGRFPSSIVELVTPDVNGLQYLDRTGVPLDPWGNPYGYELPNARTRPRIFTLGADGAPGGEGESQDIDNFQIRRGQ